MSTRWPAHVKRTPLTGQRVRVAPCCAAYSSSSRAFVAAWLVACLILFVWPPAESSVPAHADVVGCCQAACAGCPGARPRPAWRRTGACTLDRPANETLAAGRPALRDASIRSGTRHLLHGSALQHAGRGEGHHALARARGWSSIVIVTSTFHITRSAHSLPALLSTAGSR